MKSWSAKWKSSKQPRKQRKYRNNAPLHIRSKFVSVHLSKELRAQYKRRSVRVCKGDKVRILKGQFRKKEGKVEKVSLKHSKIFVTGIEHVRKEGKKSLIPIDPSNCIIVELEIKDKKRKRTLEKNLVKQPDQKEKQKLSGAK